MQKNENSVSAMLAAVTMAIVMCFAGSTVYAADPPPKTYQIGPQLVSAALKAFAAQSDMQLIFTEKDAGGVKSPGVTGTKSARQALQEILKGTGLEFEFTANNVVVVKKASATGLAAKGSDPPGDGANDPRKEGKSDSSDGFRVAQVDQGQTSSPSTVAKQDEQASKQKAAVLEEVVVTGTRLKLRTSEGPQDVKVYTREQIEQSGQTTAADFLNTLPQVSVSSTENGFQTFGGASTVQLHGLPIGTTLVLINGRRIESVSGLEQGFNLFDLNSIPLSAVERIEVVSEGSSAVYGSDAIAGVVNVILKSQFEGAEATIKHGWASGTDETSSSISWGHRWSAGSISFIGTLQNRSELQGSERSITAIGGPNIQIPTCPLGNVFSVDGTTPLPSLGGATFAAVPVGSAGKPTLQTFAGTAGKLNQCGSLFSSNSFIPATHRQGFLASGNYHLSSSTELFVELMYSRNHQENDLGVPELFGEPFFQSFTVGASNPFNPFGETVGISKTVTGLGDNAFLVNTTFYRALMGARGSLVNDWTWEVAGWQASDSDRGAESKLLSPPLLQAALNSADPSVALNPFIDGPLGSLQMLQSLRGQDRVAKSISKTLSANGYVRGPILHLPSGPIEVVVGSEYDRDSLYTNVDNPDFGFPIGSSIFHRANYAVFGETRIPILANHANAATADTLAITVAARYDNYQNVGSKTTPQCAAEWRPIDTFLVRGTYGKAFKAPSLSQEYAPAVVSSPGPVVDPLRGNQVDLASIVTGGNLHLRPETGRSKTLGLVYVSKAIPDLQLSVTHWSVDENSSIQVIDFQTLINNENLFPGDVIRASSCAGSAPCPITQVNATFVNFGEIKVAGLDYGLSYKYLSDFGQVTSSASVTQTYHYSAALQPSLPATDRTSQANDDGNWAPRWKGTLALGWKRGPYSLKLSGRYVGRYQDYDSENAIGNFWFFDANFRLAAGQAITPGSQWLKGLYLELGAVNLFNRLPQASNYQFGTLGYDPAQGDLRGRFLYGQIGLTL